MSRVKNSTTTPRRRHRASRSRLSALILGAGVIGFVGSWAHGVDIRRQTIDGGGVMFSSNGAFELSGTIGQPDAAALTGGAFSVYGGFWFPVREGDCDADGGVNLGDLPLFNTCLVGPFGGFELVECRCYDLDGDKDVDFVDAAQFMAAFDGG